VEPSTWKVLISIYVLAASGLPVWMLIQSRDFINVHILYVGVAFLLAALLAAGLGGAGVALTSGGGTASAPIPFATTGAPAAGMKAPADLAGLGPIWPGMFILIACGAVSGFHALCAGGTTCKQITSERAARRVGYWAMILETFMAVCVTGVLVVGLNLGEYARHVHPAAMGLQRAPNWILGFALSVGNTAEMGLGIPKAFGVIGAMLMLEGFLVTTLDTAVRLTRYMLEEIWAALLEVPSPARDESLAEVAGSGSIPTTRAMGLSVRVLRHYWFNSALAVGLMLCLALTNGVGAIWPLFASGNQLLAALALLVASVWLLRRQRSIFYTLVPGLLVLVTTLTMLVKLLLIYLRTWSTQPQPALLVADVILLAMTLVILSAIGRTLLSRPAKPSGLTVPAGNG
jgi:carbon starvation protein